MSYDKDTSCRKCGGQHVPFFEECKRKDVMAKAEKEYPPIAHARATPHSDWRQGGIGEVEAACMETHEMIDAVRLKNITALTAERDTLQSSLDKLTSERDELKKLLGEAVDMIDEALSAKDASQD